MVEASTAAEEILSAAQRLGINQLRLFQAASAKAVMGQISDTSRYGQDLLGRFVTNAVQYANAVAMIRTPQGESSAIVCWVFPIASGLLCRCCCCCSAQICYTTIAACV